MRVRRFALILALVFLAAHVTAIFVLPSPGLVSNLFILVTPVLGALGASARSGEVFGVMQTKWRLLAIGVGLWALGQVFYAWHTYLHGHQIAALPSDFYFFLWSVPILLAIGTGDRDEDSAPLLTMDSIQAFVAVGLVYLELFAVRSGAGVQAMGVHRLMYLYIAESLILAVAASLRLLAKPERRAVRFHRVLFYFLWTYALVSIPANYASAVLKINDGTVIDALWDLPFLVLLLGCIPQSFTRENRSVPEGGNSVSTTTLVIANACPAFFTIAVLILAAHICSERLLLGIAAMGVALFAYTARSSLLQTRYQQSQRALTAREQELRQLNGRLEEMTLQDPLTGVANRRRFEQVLEMEWNRTLRAGGELSILVMDVDHFKQINDKYGHPQGDACLVAIAQALAGRMRRGSDLLARYGGEEFVAILPGASAEEAMVVAESMRFAVSGLSEAQLWICGERTLTLSIGVSSLRPTFHDDPGTLIAAADAAMYRAKQSGRNRVEAFTVTPAPILVEVPAMV
jgi:diguanylate cyclase (GGDEF)-like protein